MKNSRRAVLHIVTLALIISGCMTATSWAANYYVDPASGNDVYAGTETSPWQTINKVNSTAFSAGDTIFFKSGQSYGALTPASGTNGGYVTYAAYGTGTKPVIAGCTVSNKSYIKFQGLQFSSTNANYPLNITTSSYISVEKCDIFAESSCTAYAALRIYMNAHHNSIVGSTIAHRNFGMQNDALNLKYNANNNLIEGNAIGTATHYALTLEGSSAAYPTYVCSNNVIRNNTINNPQGAMVEAQSNSNRNLFDGNNITGGKTSANDNNATHVFKSVSMYNIIRNNILHDNNQAAAYGISSYAYQYNSDPANNVVGNRIYNNLITAVASQPIVMDNYNPGASVLNNNVYKNNIVSNNGSSFQLIVATTAGVTNNSFRNNLFNTAATTNVVKVGGSATTVAGIQATDPAHYSGNLQADPMLSGTAPQTGSPCIGAGDFLARVSTGGSGSTITVDDAGYFSDGFGVSTGDTIRVGNTTTTVTAVNYTTNTLTLADVITCATGDPVSLPYDGAKPNIGPAA